MWQWPIDLPPGQDLRVMVLCNICRVPIPRKDLHVTAGVFTLFVRYVLGPSVVYGIAGLLRLCFPVTKALVGI
ncbi:hypothetical protein SADUNF_Sadunf05G0186700 [Salix dunnii]|uniref:Uncharacterized protein n=1 Tax=Salix dunnii TaxID=1413687 RepID=A0A835K4Y1_9ROSI|nr:hypothetical protein SADUNF_Sadunf05G0186700 [Salix dunnii]